MKANEHDTIDKLAFCGARLMADGRWHSLKDLSVVQPLSDDMREYLFLHKDMMRRMHHYLDPGKVLITDGAFGFRIADEPKMARMNKKEIEDAILDILKDGDWHALEDVYRIVIGNYHSSHCGSKHQGKVFNAYISLKAKKPIVEFDDYIGGHPVWMIRLERRDEE